MSSPANGPKPEVVSGDVVERLVRLIDQPRKLPDGAAERVRAHTHELWRQGIRRRRQRRMALAAALLAAFSAALFFLGEGLGDFEDGAGEQGPLATLVVAQEGGLLGAKSGQKHFGPGVLETGSGRAALELADGSSLRLDSATRVELQSRSRLRLEAGALYLDASGEQSFVVETPFGEVRDIGTQFELRLEPTGLRVRVREGQVDVVGGAGQHSATEGVELQVGSETVSRRQVARHGEPWRAYVDVAPTFQLEGANLGDYLDWLGRETGWQIVFQDPALSVASREIVLHGSLAGLLVTETQAAVLPTCGLEGRLEDGVLEIYHPGAGGGSPGPTR